MDAEQNSALVLSNMEGNRFYLISSGGIHLDFAGAFARELGRFRVAKRRAFDLHDHAVQQPFEAVQMAALVDFYAAEGPAPDFGLAGPDYCRDKREKAIADRVRPAKPPLKLQLYISGRPVGDNKCAAFRLHANFFD